MNAQSITEQFENLPSIFNWALEKMEYIKEDCGTYVSEKFFFSGNFKVSRYVPKNFMEQVINDGNEYLAIVSVNDAKYRGQKAFVHVSLVKLHEK